MWLILSGKLTWLVLSSLPRSSPSRWKGISCLGADSTSCDSILGYCPNFGHISNKFERNGAVTTFTAFMGTGWRHFLRWVKDKMSIFNIHAPVTGANLFWNIKLIDLSEELQTTPFKRQSHFLKYSLGCGLPHLLALYVAMQYQFFVFFSHSPTCWGLPTSSDVLFTTATIMRCSRLVFNSASLEQSQFSYILDFHRLRTILFYRLSQAPKNQRIWHE